MDPEKYINPFTDYGFKRIFGMEANKDLLIDFLNQLLEGQEKPIIDLKYLPTEHLGATEYDRRAVFDLYCTTSDGDYFLVEMQMAAHKFIKDRTLFYATFPVQSQAKKGDWDFNLKKVYAVGILKFCFDEASGTSPFDVKTVAQLHNSQSKELFYDKLNLIFLEMPKFNKSWQECETRFEKWLYLLKNLPLLDRMPEKLKEQIFTKLFEIAEISKMNAEEYRSYFQSRKVHWDNYSAFMTATEKGLQQGLQKGLEQGLQQGLQQGIEMGIEKGIEQGKQVGQLSGTLETLYQLYSDGDVSLEKTSSRMKALLGQGNDDLVKEYLKKLGL